MKINEFSKPAPAPGFFARLFGRTVNSYALAIVFGADAVDKVATEIAAARIALLEWVGNRKNKDFVIVSAYTSQPVCDAIEQGMTKLCREDSELGPLLRTIPVELSFNGKQKKNV